MKSQPSITEASQQITAVKGNDEIINTRMIIERFMRLSHNLPASLPTTNAAFVRAIETESKIATANFDLIIDPPAHANTLNQQMNTIQPAVETLANKNKMHAPLQNDYFQLKAEITELSQQRDQVATMIKGLIVEKDEIVSQLKSLQNKQQPQAQITQQLNQIQKKEQEIIHKRTQLETQERNLQYKFNELNIRITHAAINAGVSYQPPRPGG